MSTATTTLRAEITAVMLDVAVDVPGVATAIGRREVAAHQSPPSVGWLLASEAPTGARKNAFPGGRRELYSSALTLTVRCWGIAATPDRTYATDDVEALLLLRESVIAGLHRRFPGVAVWSRATYVTDPSASDLGEIVDLAITLPVGVLDRAPLRATVTTADLVPPAAPFGDGVLSPGEQQ